MIRHSAPRTIQELIVDPREGWTISSEYLRGATTLRDLSGEFAGFPAYSSSLADQRQHGSPDNDPERLLTRLVDEHHSIAVAHDRYGIRPGEEEPAGFATRQRQTVMLGSLVIRHPGASATELADIVFGSYVEPQQLALAADFGQEDLRGQVAETAMAGMELYDQLVALSQ